MVKKQLLGASVRHLVDELSPEIPEDKQSEVQNEVSKKLKVLLGENWAVLPVTGPYMMLAVLVLNYLLLPMGITPVKVADTAISKSREYDIDSKFAEILVSARKNAQSTGEFTSEKIKELTDYSEEKGKIAGERIMDVLDTSVGIGKSVLSRGKSLGRDLISSVRSTIDNDEAEDVER